jgi:hypothetical protein
LALHQVYLLDDETNFSSDPAWRTHSEARLPVTVYGGALKRFACHAQNALNYVAFVMQPPKLSIDALEHCSKGTPTIFVIFRILIMQ